MIIRFLRWVFFGFFIQIFGAIIGGVLILYFLVGGGDGLKKAVYGWWDKLAKTSVQVNIEKDGTKTEYNVLTPQK